MHTNRGGAGCVTELNYTQGQRKMPIFLLKYNYFPPKKTHSMLNWGSSDVFNNNKNLKNTECKHKIGHIVTVIGDGDMQNRCASQTLNLIKMKITVIISFFSI